MQQLTLVIQLYFICYGSAFLFGNPVKTPSGEVFVIMGNVTCFELCEVPENTYLKIHIKRNGTSEGRHLGRGPFPISFVFTPLFHGPGVVTAQIIDGKDKVYFYSINSALLNDFNRSRYEVNFNVTRCPLITCKCPYGLRKDTNGCDTCKCFDPCFPVTEKVLSNDLHSLSHPLHETV